MQIEWAVVTGSSSGLGVAYADRLAQQGANLILAARRAELLEEVAADLRHRHGVRVETRPVDLALEADRTAFADELAETPVHTMVNNAGFGTVGKLAELRRDRIAEEVALNAGAVTELTHAVLPGMVARRRGAIINVASTAAFQAMSTMAVYSATKAYVLQFSVGLWAELHGSGVRVLAVCPGPTATRFFAYAGDDAMLKQRRQPEQVVDTTFHALEAHKPFVVDGTRNKAVAFATRFVPRGLAARIAPTFMKLT